VTFDNFRVHGKLIAKRRRGEIAVNPHTKNITFISDTTPPADAPKITEIKALPGDPQVVLLWSKVTTPRAALDHYNVYRDDRKVGEARETTYADKDAREETAYTYCVAAISAAGLGRAKSAAAQAKTLPIRNAQAAVGRMWQRPAHVKWLQRTRRADRRGNGR